VIIGNTVKKLTRFDLRRTLEILNVDTNVQEWYDRMKYQSNICSSGDCGLGYYKSFMIVNVMVLLAYIPNMAVMLSWISSAGSGLLFVPLVYENAFVVPMWIVGTLAVIPGYIAAYSDGYVSHFIVNTFSQEFEKVSLVECLGLASSHLCYSVCY